jgi:predicted TIM-barrel fold metal-dependent hydrolase
MFVSEDGYVTGSIDVSKLDEIEPKSDEARAQLDALKRDAQQGQEQAARDAERLAEQSRVQDAQLRGEGQRSQSEQKRDADRQQQDAGPDQSAEVKQLQAEAEAAGVTVDKRWGADRLRQEIDAAKASRKKG